MSKSPEITPDLTEAQYKQPEKELRTQLLDAQFDLVEAQDHAVLILINGSDFSGKAQLAYQLCDWLDLHYVDNLAFRAPSETERQLPPLQRYWQVLPPRGRIAIIYGSWYHQPIRQYALGQCTAEKLEAHLRRIADFETQLAQNGVQLLKLWLDITPEEEALRSAAVTQRKTLPPLLREWQGLGQLTTTQIANITKQVFDRTHTHQAPWHNIAADNPWYRNLRAGQLLLARLQTKNELPGNNRLKDQAETIVPRRSMPDQAPTLAQLDLSPKLDRSSYDKALLQWQSWLNALSKSDQLAQRSLLLIFEGTDAAGKGGCIRRITGALDPRQFRVYPIGVPTAEEAARPYLWRFWTKLPQAGSFSILDRSYYGRVLVERVEKLIAKPDWRRAYGEIRDFEQQLTESGIIVVKFWLQISKDEQLRRFKARDAKPYKRYKLTPEDWRNREKWDQYQAAAQEMFDQTHSCAAPWHLISAEDKEHARIEVLKVLVAQLEQLR